MLIEDKLNEAIKYIKNADALVITAGAGMSVDSGLPDFRGINGFWSIYPVLAEAKLSFEQIATPNTFQTDPFLAWGFYGHRLNAYRTTMPHNGFNILLKWIKQYNKDYFIVTSNVDGHFQKVGFNADKIIEIHGSINQLQCTVKCTNTIWSAEEFNPVVEASTCRLISQLPKCPTCGKLARPNILMFNDTNWVHQNKYFDFPYFKEWLKEKKNPITIELGAGKIIFSIRSFGESLNAPLIRINPRDSFVYKRRSVSLPLKALDALEKLDYLLNILQ